VTHDEVPIQMLRRVLYVGNLLAAIEAQEHIDTQSSHKQAIMNFKKPKVSITREILTTDTTLRKHRHKK
jgi:hypothetical protein